MPTDTYNVAVSADDGYCHDLSFDAASDNLHTGYLNDGGNNRRSFIRFAGVTIAASQTITLAELDLTDWWTNGAANCDITRLRAQDSAAPVAPTTVAEIDTALATVTTASATLDLRTIGQTLGTLRTVDVTSIVQELYASYSYAGGAAMEFLLDPPSPVDQRNNIFGSVDHATVAYRPVLRITYSAAAGTQWLVPASDVVTAGWTPTPASPTTLFDKLDEGATPNDADYVATADLVAANTPLTLTFTAGSPPGTAGGRIVHTRVKLKGVVGGSANVQSELLQGATVIASWTDTVTSTTETTFSHTLSTAEENAITDYTTLQLRVTLLAA